MIGIPFALPSPPLSDSGSVGKFLKLSTTVKIRGTVCCNVRTTVNKKKFGLFYLVGLLLLLYF